MDFISTSPWSGYCDWPIGEYFHYALQQYPVELIYLCVIIYMHIYKSYAYVCIVNTFTLSASMQIIIVLFLPYFSQMVFLQLLLYLNTLLSYLLLKSKGSPLKKKYLCIGFNSYCSHPKMTYFDFSSTTFFCICFCFCFCILTSCSMVH